MMLAATAQAEPSCQPTGSILTHNYPGASAIPTTNNLLLPTGKAVAAQGQKVTIHGRLLDITCKPVPNAVVELWQDGPTGRWLLAGDDDIASPRAVFAGAGRTYTDMDGNFTFITAFPAPIRGGGAPFVNVKVVGRGIPELVTALYFSGDRRNDTDKWYQRVSDRTRSDTLIHMSQDRDNDLNGDVQLVISGKAPYRTY